MAEESPKEEADVDEGFHRVFLTFPYSSGVVTYTETLLISDPLSFQPYPHVIDILKKLNILR